MINIEKVLDKAIELKGSDVHLICGLKPKIRVSGELTACEDESILTEEDLYEIYEYFVRGNINKDQIYKETRRLDIAYHVVSESGAYVVRW